MSVNRSMHDPNFIIHFECGGVDLAISSPKEAKKLTSVLSGESFVLTKPDNEKIIVSTADKAAAIFHNVFAIRIMVSSKVVTTGPRVDITSEQNALGRRFKSLSTAQIIDLLNFAYEPISNSAWDTYLNKFNPVHVLDID